MQRKANLATDAGAVQCPAPGEQLPGILRHSGRQAKFARHPYPHKVHNCWAARGLMPELRTLPNGTQVTYVPGSWSLVYMDYLSPSDGWQTLRKVPAEEPAITNKHLTPEALHSCSCGVVDTPHHFMHSRVLVALSQHLHASVCCTQPMQLLHWLQVTSGDAELEALAEDVLLQLHEPCPLRRRCRGVCAWGSLRSQHHGQVRSLGLTSMRSPCICCFLGLWCVAATCRPRLLHLGPLCCSSCCVICVRLHALTHAGATQELAPGSFAFWV